MIRFYDNMIFLQNLYRFRNDPMHSPDTRNFQSLAKHGTKLVNGAYIWLMGNTKSGSCLHNPIVACICFDIRKDSV